MKDFNTYHFAGKHALIRVDFNVPLDENYHITDTTRIDAAIPTSQNLIARRRAAIRAACQNSSGVTNCRILRIVTASIRPAKDMRNR